MYYHPSLTPLSPPPSQDFGLLGGVVTDLGRLNVLFDALHALQVGEGGGGEARGGGGGDALHAAGGRGEGRAAATDSLFYCLPNALPLPHRRPSSAPLQRRRAGMRLDWGSTRGATQGRRRAAAACSGAGASSAGGLPLLPRPLPPLLVLQRQGAAAAAAARPLQARSQEAAPPWPLRSRSTPSSCRRPRPRLRPPVAPPRRRACLRWASAPSSCCCWRWRRPVSTHAGPRRRRQQQPLQRRMPVEMGSMRRRWTSMRRRRSRGSCARSCTAWTRARGGHGSWHARARRRCRRASCSTPPCGGRREAAPAGQVRRKLIMHRSKCSGFQA